MSPRRAYLSTVAGLLAAGVAVLAGRQAYRTHQARADYFPKRAIIIEKVEEPYRLRLGYMDRHSLPHQAEAEVSKSDWDQYQGGHFVDVYVSGADPDRAWLQTQGAPGYGSPVLLGLLAFVLGLTCAAFALA